MTGKSLQYTLYVAWKLPPKSLYSAPQTASNNWHTEKLSSPQHVRVSSFVSRDHSCGNTLRVTSATMFGVMLFSHVRPTTICLSLAAANNWAFFVHPDRLSMCRLGEGVDLPPQGGCSGCTALAIDHLHLLAKTYQLRYQRSCRFVLTYILCSPHPPHVQLVSASTRQRLIELLAHSKVQKGVTSPAWHRLLTCLSRRSSAQSRTGLEVSALTTQAACCFWTNTMDA